MSATIMHPASAAVRPGFRTRMSTLWAEMKANKISYLFVAPFMILFAVFVVVPILLSIGLSFTYFNMVQPPKWVGWQNYLTLFLEDEVFLIAVKNTFFFAAITGPLSYVMCFVCAWLINELSPKIRTILTLMFYGPSISANAYLIWTVMFSGDSYGYINGLLLYWGVLDKPILWLQDPQWMMTIVIIVVLWMSLGVSFLTFIAGLQGIDRTYYEAGAIDGIRNRWQELWFITLPDDEESPDVWRHHQHHQLVRRIRGSCRRSPVRRLPTGPPGRSCSTSTTTATSATRWVTPRPWRCCFLSPW